MVCEVVNHEFGPSQGGSLVVKAVPAGIPNSLGMK